MQRRSSRKRTLKVFYGERQQVKVSNLCLFLGFFAPIKCLLQGAMVQPSGRVSSTQKCSTVCGFIDYNAIDITRLTGMNNMTIIPKINSFFLDWAMPIKNILAVSLFIQRRKNIILMLANINQITSFSFSKATLVILKYNDLLVRSNLESAIEEAFGPKGQGILFVSGIPDYPELRRATLPLFFKLANLPKVILQKYERPEVYFSQGWSHGKEKFQGQYDVSKGSYYINCARDHPLQYSKVENAQFTADELKMNVANRWVDEIPEIETQVKKLSRVMMDVGALVALQIDSYISEKVPSYTEGKLHRIISKGTSHIGRILHYFPFEEKGSSVDDWCGWHNDHGSLTALTSAIYLNQSGHEVQVATSSGGLYAKNRFAEMTQVGIPRDMLAFQIGESMQIHSGGYLEATPHCVVRNQDIAGKGISRQTFALFMEPDFLEEMSTPAGISPEEVSSKKAYKIPAISERWQNGILFKKFHSNTISFYS